MKKITLLLLPFLAALGAKAQTSIELKDIGSHVGDSVTVCGPVSGGRFFTRDSITLLNMGGAYPNQQLTVLIRPEARSGFGDAPETMLRDKNICVSGKVILYKDKPEIILYSRQQLVSTAAN